MRVFPKDDCPAKYHRYPTRAALVRLTSLLKLQLGPYSQDWEVELADASRLADFLDLYEGGELDDDDRFLLMGMIVASLDDAASLGAEVASAWDRADVLLRRDGSLHATTLSYWAQGDDPDPDHQFAVTPRIRSIWRDVLRTLERPR